MPAIRLTLKVKGSDINRLSRGSLIVTFVSFDSRSSLQELSENMSIELHCASESERRCRSLPIFQRMLYSDEKSDILKLNIS